MDFPSEKSMSIAYTVTTLTEGTIKNKGIQEYVGRVKQF